MRGLSLYIVVVLLASCSAPRQLAPVTIEKIVTLHDTITVAAPVPATTKSENFVVDWDGGDFFDVFEVEDSTSSAKVVATGNRAEGKRSYYLTTTRKRDTINIMVPVTITDTLWIECPPILPVVPSGGGFPWGILGTALVALLLWFTTKGRKKKQDLP